MDFYSFHCMEIKLGICFFSESEMEMMMIIILIIILIIKPTIITSI